VAQNYDIQISRVLQVPLIKNLRHQIGAFSFVGLANTAIDFLILNIGILVFNLPILFMNLISTSIAMMFSYFFSKRWVFSGSNVTNRKSMGLFVLVTLVGLYGIQSLVILIFSQTILLPSGLAAELLAYLNITGLSEEFIISNTAKALATVATAVWNFILYKKLVFRV
jgi:putative flippase GtrA